MRLVAYLIGAAALAAFPSVASATTLFDQTNLANQTNTPITRTFTATGVTSNVSFGGYNPPSWTYATNILLTLSGGSTNLLGTAWLFTPAASGSYAYQYGPGSYGTNNLAFGGYTPGSYDTFSQIVNTVAGDSYTLSFLLSSGGGDNGLRITASNATFGGAVPEPATWAMMLLGFGAIGIAVRRSRKQKPGSILQLA